MQILLSYDDLSNNFMKVLRIGKYNKSFVCKALQSLGHGTIELTQKWGMKMVFCEMWGTFSDVI